MATIEVDLEEVKAAIEWQHDGSTRWLATPDPHNTFVRFTLRVNKTCALFEIMIPIRYKDHRNPSAAYIHINPRNITSIVHSTRNRVPDAIKCVFPSATCLQFQLDHTVTVLIPTFVKTPIAVARLRSGRILDSLNELLQKTSLCIYIPDDALSVEQLDLVSTAITQRQLNPFSGPDYDVSRWFSGSGAKILNPPRAPPPSYDNVTAAQADAPLYDESTTFDPPTTRSHKRKRSKELIAEGGAIWDKLLALEAVVHHDKSLLVQELRAEIAELRGQLSRCEKKVLDLETEVAGLREAQHVDFDAEGVELMEIRDDVRTLEGRIDFITRGEDDEEFKENLKEEVLEELVARISRG
ncbi:hypothetical protein ACHAPU_011433 [Fusarium lateritium]